MQTFQRAVLLIPMVAWLAAACDRANTPSDALTGARPTALARSGSYDEPGGKDDNGTLRAVPFVFVGGAGDCGPVAGSRIVTAAWLGGMGLPDNGGTNVGDNQSDPHFGLLLSKNGLTADCSSSGARIEGVRGMTLDATSELGFDYRNGGHCGAGAPRMNVVVRTSVTNTETFHFVGGCSNDHTPTPAPQDPVEWTRVRFGTSDPTETFPVIPPGSTVVSISILYDEGTDVPTIQDPNGVGLAVIDNIFIKGRTISSGKAISDGHNGGDE